MAKDESNRMYGLMLAGIVAGGLYFAYWAVKSTAGPMPAPPRELEPEEWLLIAGLLAIPASLLAWHLARWLIRRLR